MFSCQRPPDRGAVAIPLAVLARMYLEMVVAVGDVGGGQRERELSGEKGTVREAGREARLHCIRTSASICEGGLESRPHPIRMVMVLCVKGCVVIQVYQKIQEDKEKRKKKRRKKRRKRKKRKIHFVFG